MWNEKAANAAIQQILLTRVIMAHRPETIAMAQRVVVLQQGKVAQDALQETKEAQKMPLHFKALSMQNPAGFAAYLIPKLPRRIS